MQQYRCGDTDNFNTFLVFLQYRSDNRSYTICTAEWRYLVPPLLVDFNAAGSTESDLLLQLLSVLHMRVCRKGKKPALGRFLGPTKPGGDKMTKLV